MSLPVLNANPCVANGCASCCYDTEMPLLEEDAARLEKLGHKRSDFSFVKDEDSVLYLRTVPRPEGMPETGRSPADVKAGKPGQPCFFLKDNKCSVYAERPTGCRIYPFVLTEEQRLLRDDDCPHHRSFPVDPSLKRRIQKIAGTLAREAAKRG